MGGDFLWKKHGDAREAAWLDEALGWLRVYDVDSEVVRAAADIQAEAMRKGAPLPDMDLLVGLSAKSDSELLTLDEDQRDMKDALGSKGVSVLFLPREKDT